MKTPRPTRSTQRSINAPDGPRGDGHPDIELRQRIATSAYYKAQARGFAPGRELEDWLEAEAEHRGHAIRHHEQHRARRSQGGEDEGCMEQR